MVEHKSSDHHKEGAPAHAPAPEVSMSMNDSVPAATPAPAHVTTGPHPTSGLAIASMITGIVAFLFGWTPVFGFLLGATAIVLGIIALKKPGPKGMSVAGIVTGGVGALWSFFVGLFFFIGLLAISASGSTVGSAIDEANKNLDQYNAGNKALIEAKNDFKKGDTAKFGQFEVKVNSIKRDYAPESSYLKADAGNEFIVLNVTVKNTGSDEKFIGAYDLKIDDAGIVNTSSYLDVDPAFNGGTMKAGATDTGNIVYQVTKGSTDLKLQYEQIVYDLNGGVKTLTFTLVI